MASSSGNASDWDSEKASISYPRPIATVREDWEDDDDEQEVPNEEVNRRIWEEADRKASAPMPALISSSSSRSMTAPPPAAFQPALKILKRPQPNSNSITPPPTVSASTSTESFQEREARYQVARNRIFGESANPESTSSSTTSLSSLISREDRSKASGNKSPATTSITRNPRGPENSNSRDGIRSSSKGFESRRGKPPPQLTQSPSKSFESEASEDVG